MRKVAIIHGAYLHRRHTDHLRVLSQWYNLVGVSSRHRALELTDVGFEVRQLLAVSDVVRRIPKLKHHISWGSDQYLLGFDKALRDIDILYPSSSPCLFTWQAAKLKKKTGAKLVIHEVENIPLQDIGRWLFPYKQEALHEADAIIAATEHVRSSLIIEGVSPEKITCIPFGVDTDLFSPEHRDPAVLGQLGCESNEKTILFSGRIVWGKGVFDIAYAAKLMMEDSDLRDVPFKFVFLGSGSGEAQLKQRLQYMGVEDKFSFVGFIPYKKVPTIYASVDITLAPSIPTMQWQEQFPLMITECLASGTALVTTYTAGPMDVAGAAAAYVNPSDHLSLYRAIKDLLLDDVKRRELGRMGRERALNVLDQMIVAQRTSEVFESINS